MKPAMFGLILLLAAGAAGIDARADSATPTTADTSTPVPADAPPADASAAPAASVDAAAPAAEAAPTPAADAPITTRGDNSTPAAEALAAEAASTPVEAPAPIVGEAPPADIVACDVELNVVDPDPKGLNVRAAPNAKKGKVVAVLKPIGDWTQVHVIGQSGDWLRIDHAEAIDDSAENGQRQVFQGDGWVHASKLGISELYVGGGTVIRDRPVREGAELLRVSDEAKEPKSTKILGCDGKFIKVQADKQIGWTDSWCTNERTTCS